MNIFTEGIGLWILEVLRAMIIQRLKYALQSFKITFISKFLSDKMNKPVRRHPWRSTSEPERDKSVFDVASMSRLSGFRDSETGDARANVQVSVS